MLRLARSALFASVPAMQISLFLPHVGIFGGVRRSLELGSSWGRQGHQVTLFHPEGGAPGWLPFSGRTAPTRAAAQGRSDIALCGDPHTFDTFRRHEARAHLY